MSGCQARNLQAGTRTVHGVVAKVDAAVNFPGMLRVDFTDGTHRVWWPDEMIGLLRAA